MKDLHETTGCVNSGDINDLDAAPSVAELNHPPSPRTAAPMPAEGTMPGVEPDADQGVNQEPVDGLVERPMMGAEPMTDEEPDADQGVDQEPVDGLVKGRKTARIVLYPTEITGVKLDKPG